MVASVYIHIPFCARKCRYCDFCSYAGREGDERGYLAQLEQELLQARKTYGRLRVPSVYFGGGTPSLMHSDTITHLLAMIRALFQPDDDAEITIEVNPATVDRAKLIDYRDAGVNRISIGAQSFDDRLLKLLGRIHQKDAIENTVHVAREAGFRNISLDLMYGLPTQTMREWVDTLTCALRLAPEHLSCYSLILEDGTPLAAQVLNGELAMPDEETVLQMQHAAQRILAKRGFVRYEISNYSQPGKHCRHNIVYWTRANYLGLGCAAHSLMDDVRFANTTSLDEYLSGVTKVSEEPISPASAREEMILLGTRMAEGIDLSLVRDKKEALEKLRALDLVQIRANRVQLTQKGWDVHNAVVLQLV